MNRNQDKLKTLVHYICWKCDNPAMLGAIKLNKVLWVSDIRSYVLNGDSITGETYVKRQFGPVPRSILNILRDLEFEKKVVIREKATQQGYTKTDYFALSKPEIDTLFSAEEISLIDDAIHYVCHKHTAKGISDKTHDAIWQLAELGEEIPYEAMLASTLGEVTPEDVDWAKEALAVRA